MKKKLVVFTMFWLCNHNAFTKQPSMESDIQEYLTKHPDICATYYVATPDKVLAKGVSDCRNDKSKHIRPGAYQVQTTDITKTMTAASIMLLHEQKKLNLNDHILKYIRADCWPNSQPPYWASEVTIHHLIKTLKWYCWL